MNNKSNLSKNIKIRINMSNNEKTAIRRLILFYMSIQVSKKNLRYMISKDLNNISIPIKMPKREEIINRFRHQYPFLLYIYTALQYIKRVLRNNNNNKKITKIYLTLNKHIIFKTSKI